MDTKRLEIIISNLLSYLHDNYFNGDSEEFVEKLNSEIGINYQEMAILSINNNFPEEAKKFIIKEVFDNRK